MMRSKLMLLVMLLCTALHLRAQQEAPEANTTPVQDVDKPIPPVAQLLSDVERNERAGEAARKEYTYHVHSVEEETGNDGHIKKTTTEDAESLTISGVRVNRVVARDGKPLDEKEARKESERIDKVVDKEKDRREKLRASGKDSTDNGEAVMPASRFLELGTFSNPRRVLVYGRPTIALDYAGDPNAKTKNEFEGVVRDLVGTVWIDEADHVLVKSEGHFLKDFKIGGGLVVNIHQGFSFSFRQQKVHDEVWLPVEIEGYGSARIFLFDKIAGRFKLETSDYRKFHTSATIVQHEQVVGPDGQPLLQPPPTPPASPTQ